MADWSLSEYTIVAGKSRHSPPSSTAVRVRRSWRDGNSTSRRKGSSESGVVTLACGVVHINESCHVVVVPIPGHFDQTRVDVYNILRLMTFQEIRIYG